MVRHVNQLENKTKSIKLKQNRSDNTLHAAAVVLKNSAVKGTLSSIVREKTVLVSIHLLLMTTIAARVVLMRAKMITISPNAQPTPIRPLIIGVTIARTPSTSTKKMLSLKNQRRKKTRSLKILKALIKEVKLPQPHHLLLPISMMILTKTT